MNTNDRVEVTSTYGHELSSRGYETNRAGTGSLVKRFPLLKPHLNSLYGLSADPNTIDNERYARKTRALAKRCSEAMLARETSPEATQVRVIFVGLHRLLDWDAPVQLNANLIGNALEAADIICSTAGFDDCTCVSDPDLICFAEDHLI